MQDPILITGAARSGTSMVAGAINKCGAFGGDMSGPNPNNQKGMYENYVIRNDIVKSYMQSIGVCPKGQYPLPNIRTLPVYNNWHMRINQIMVNQGYIEGHWFYKGAKMCLTWPLWAYAFPNAKWIVVRRTAEDIVDSCMKTGFMTAFAREDIQRKVGVNNEREGWIWWVRQHQKRFIEMIQEGLNVKVVWPERMVNGDYSQIKEAIEWVGLEWSSEVVNFIEPKLWKARKKK